MTHMAPDRKGQTPLSLDSSWSQSTSPACLGLTSPSARRRQSAQANRMECSVLHTVNKPMRQIPIHKIAVLDNDGFSKLSVQICSHHGYDGAAGLMIVSSPVIDRTL